MSPVGDTSGGSGPYNELRVVDAGAHFSLVPAKPVHAGHADRATRLKLFGHLMDEHLVCISRVFSVRLLKHSVYLLTAMLIVLIFETSRGKGRHSNYWHMHGILFSA